MVHVWPFAGKSCRVITEELGGDAGLSRVRMGCRERVPRFKTSSLRIILLGRSRGLPGTYGRRRVSTRQGRERDRCDERVDCSFPRS